MNQYSHGALTPDKLQDFSDAFHSDKASMIAANASVKNGLIAAATDYSALQKLPYSFSIDLKQGSITNQKSSGRCWLFSALNTFRYEIIRRYNLEDFELSQNYLFFYDKLERSNFFLENMLALLDEPLDGRLMQFLLRDPLGDGGQWDMFANLVEKYGVVPRQVYPDGANSVNSHLFDQYLATLLREYTWEFRTAHETGASIEQLRTKKDGMMKDFYRILCICLGEPPAVFDYNLTSKDGKTTRLFHMTGRDFFRQYVGLDLKDYVSLIHAPTQDKPFQKLYTVKYLGNVAEGSPVTYLNLPIQAIKKAAVAQLKESHPVWFGSDCMQFALREEAVFDRASANLEQLLGISYRFGKKERLLYGDSAMDHAMVFLGVNLTEEGQPDRWRIENSWGKDSGPNGGYYIASDSWFDEFVYQVVVHKNYLDEETLRLLSQERIPLEPWDPMGTLAR